MYLFIKKLIMNRRTSMIIDMSPVFHRLFTRARHFMEPQ